MTILLVEDNPDQLAVRAMLLRQEGYQVLEAASYATAMAAAGYECAIVDLRLPTEQEGLRLIKDLKAARPAVLVYVLTGMHSPRIPLADEIFRKGSAVVPLLQRLRSLQLRQEV